MPIKVLLADDTDVVRRIICKFLESHPEIEVVGEASNFVQTIQIAEDLKPQVIVLDLHMPDETSVEPLQIKSLNHGSRLLAISVWNDEETRALAERFGADAFLDKADLGIKLIPTIVQLASAA